MPASPRQRIILHVDMDAFYAAIEQRDDPSLRGRPLIIGGRERRGVVCTASYEARPFGVHSAMAMTRALRHCPHAIVRPPRIDYYAEISEQVMDALANFSPLVEPLSLDEAFLDMTGAEALFGPPDAMARAIKEEIWHRTRLTASVGIGKNKFLAKLASDLDKPDGITWVPFGGERAFIAPLSVRKLWGVGPKAASALAAIGLRTIGDLAAADSAMLANQLGTHSAAHLAALARAEDDRPVEPDRERKSVGSEVTLADDIRGREQIVPILRRQCERVAEHLRRDGLVARGVRIKLRYSEGFRLASRQRSVEEPYDDSVTLFTVASALLTRLELDHPIRLVGAAAFDLAEHAKGQLELFAPASSERSALEHAVDAIRARFGDKIRFGE
jgi:DNA polymerase IV